MISDLLSGLRSLRVSLVAGSMLVGSTYIVLHGALTGQIIIHTAAKNLLNLSPIMPMAMAAFLCITVGSLFTTLLEGIIDRLHRRYVLRVVNENGSPWERTVIQSFLPYSDSARRRLQAEVTNFYDRNTESGTTGDDEQSEFVAKVFTEILWMEGKLAGTVLESPYDKMRSEGEIRVAGGLLLPITCFAAAFSVCESTAVIFAAVTMGILVAVPMINYGLYYFKKSNSFLAHHIADGKVLSPSMETLIRLRMPKNNSLNETSLGTSRS